MADQTCPKLLRGVQTLAGKTIPTGAFVTPAIVRLRHAWHSCVADGCMIQFLIKLVRYNSLTQNL